MIRLTLGLLLVGIGMTLLTGCGQGEVSQQDQSAKMEALHKAEQDSRAKDGVKSE